MKPNKKIECISNIQYALKNIWKWDKNFYLFSIPLIPIGVILSILNIYFPKILIDSLELGRGIRSTLTVILLYFIVIFMLTFIRLFCNAKLSARKYNISSIYQNMIYEKYMLTDYYNTDSPTENIKFQNAINDANSNCSPEFIWQSLLEFLKSALGLITYGTIILTVSPFILLLLIISALVIYFLGSWQRKYFEHHKDQLSALDRKIAYFSKISSSFDYAKDIRIFNLSDWLSKILLGVQKEQLSWWKKQSIRSFLAVCCSALMNLLRDGAAYTVLIIFLLNGKIDSGDFVFLFGAITGFSGWLNGISDKVNDLVNRGIKIGYYREYFDMKENFNHGTGISLPSSRGFPIEINFENVSFQYCSDEKNQYALKNINLTICPGEKLAIVGENGAGKTTLVKLLCGLYYPTCGSVKVNGKCVEDYNIELYYTLFSPVFQDIYLLPITIAEFVASCDKDSIQLEKVHWAIDRAGLSKKIDSLVDGVNTHLVKGVFEDSVDFSGGEKQKLLFARALYKDAPIIILDEPTSALDPIAENEIYLQYNELTKGKTSIYISHRLASTRFCDRIIYLEQGKIIEEGSHDELIKLGGKYAYMYRVQSQYYMEKQNNEK